MKRTARRRKSVQELALAYERACGDVLPISDGELIEACNTSREAKRFAGAITLLAGNIAAGGVIAHSDAASVRVGVSDEWTASLAAALISLKTRVLTGETSIEEASAEVYEIGKELCAGEALEVFNRAAEICGI